MLPGSPCICIKQIGTFAAAAASRAPSRVSARTSFNKPAPAFAASRINTGVLVSTEMTVSNSAAIRATNGNTLSISSFTETGLAPGRVDSPPISRIAAPDATISRARVIALSISRFEPRYSVAPSENESGVTLMMPITTGRDKSSRRPAHSNTGPAEY